ncbi:hypothetical protein C5167_014912 [Papaver somniferum]|uniref:Knotted 1-binding protein 36 n=1 Tax=Papaver somniferum TaxID=3469 RepID=A0A4Y7J4I9_PAPSO|nr:uncharacterized protein LOC113361871 [Papaver somniferum]XP_026460748.1 uncharacterized protein LOC113361871 [Papaver somniferum]RZC56053.1 hypothetical protein C5167_014912 [Papaver somniferum]
MDEIETTEKRIKQTMAEEDDEENEIGLVMDEDVETVAVGSEEMENLINGVLEKIERFTQQVSEMLEAGKTLFKDLSNEFEERIIGIHKEQIEKWQDEIKELRSLDAMNEEANTRLHMTRSLFQNVQI